MLTECGRAFEELYVAAFEVLDRRWLAASATYMQFPLVLDATMMDVQRVLESKPSGVAAMRSQLGLHAGH